MVSVALIGAGRIGRIRAQVIQSSSGSKLACVVDSDRSRAEKIAQGVGGDVRAETDWMRATSDPSIQAVVVSTPTQSHAEITLAALRSGKHVLCEKPLGLNAQQAWQMEDAALACGRILKTGFNYRDMAHVIKATQLLEANALGPVYFLRSRFGHGGRPGYEREWCTQSELSGGGVLLEQGIHIFDLVRVFLGEPSRVFARTHRYFWGFADAEDNGFCTLETSDGKVAHIHISWTQWTNIFEVEIFGRDGYIRLEGRDGHYGPQRLIWGKRQADHSRPQQEIHEFPEADDSWVRQWRRFIDQVESAPGRVSTTNDGSRTQEIVEALYKSSINDSWVSLPTSHEKSQGVSS